MDQQSHLDSERFHEEGFSNLVVKCTEKELQCRTNVCNEVHFKAWKELYCMVSRTSLNVVRTSTPVNDNARTVFCQHLICQFGSKRHKGVKKHSTGCSFQMTVQIKKGTTRKRIRDKLVATHPCVITITGAHNHMDRAETLKELRVLPGVNEAFEEYFKRGMGTTEAHRYHQLKMDFSGDFCVDRARGDTNPKPRSVEHMFQKWLKSAVVGYSDENMFDALEKFAVKSKSVIEVERSGSGSFCVALVTPFMKRVHRLREASEVVFVDVVASVDQSHTAVVPFHCSSPAGVLPLGVVFASSRDETDLTKGFHLLRKALGESAFGGRGHPVAFTTDSCDAMKNALRTVWPMAAQFLCVSHVLQKVWNWLLDSRHEVGKEKRQEFMDTLRKLAYAESPEHFQALLDGLNVNHVGFASYLANLVKSRAEWAIAFRQGTLHRSHHTNNHAAATMCIIKDIVQNRCKARNACELVMLMDEIYNGFMVQRLIDFALDQRQSKRLAPSSVPEKAITRVDKHHFRVIIATDAEVTYDVALDVGTCSCEQGQSGGACKHQVACAHWAMLTLPQAFLPTPENRRWLMCVAVAEEKAPELDFFADFRARESTGARWDPPTDSDADTNTGLVVPVDPDSVLPVGDDTDDFESDEPASQPSPAEEAMSPASQPSPVEEAMRPASQPSPVEEAMSPASQPNPAEEAVGPVSKPSPADEAVRPASQLNPADEVAGPTSQPISAEELERPASHVIAKFHEAVDRALELLGDGLTNETLQKATGRVASLTTSGQLNSWLDSVGFSAECSCRGAAGRVETNVQPTSVSHQPAEGLPRGASRLGKGRHPAGAPEQAAKRHRCLGENVATNETNDKSHSLGC